MTGPDWTETDRLFQLALERPPQARAAFVDEATEHDPALRARLHALVDAAALPSGALGLVVGKIAADAAPAPMEIGPYRVGRLLGRGGMGEVYLAERDLGGAVQRVALKRLRPGLGLLDGPSARARFQQERHVLARLEHPHIARLLDGGETADGAPFLAMEFVDGEPITAYCARHRLPLADRLGLMMQVARAVDAAHRRLVVHRDLKPGNILVGQDDHGRPVPKLLDFGIAKLLEADSSAAPLTQTGWRPLTPEYAAPEQLRGDPVTTATDVYALGVVLYEVLTGRRPFHGATGLALERAVLGDAPTRPSGQVSEAAAPPLSASDLRGDLDTICLTALRTEPERRYASAAALADDLARVLGHRPIDARPATLGYLAGRFVRRNQAGVLAAAAAVAALVVGLGAALWQGREAGRERDRAAAEARRSEQATDFLADLLYLGDPYEGGGLPAAALPDSGAARLDRADGMDPLLQADLLLTLGDVFKAQGRFDAHEAAARQAVRVLRAGGAPPLRLGIALTDQTLALDDLERWDEAEPLGSEAVGLLRALPGQHDAALEAVQRLADVLYGLGRHEEALALVAGEIPRARRLGEAGRPHWALVDLREIEAKALAALGRTDQAAQAARQVVASAEAVYPPGSADEQSVRYNMAEVLMRAGRYAEAGPLFRAVYAVELRTLPPGHPDLAMTRAQLAVLALAEGRPAQAARLAQLAERVYAATFEPSSAAALEVQLVLALAAFRTGAPAPAERRLRDALARPGLAPADRAWLEAGLGAVLHARGGGPTAEPRADGGRLPPWRRALLRDLVGPAGP